MSCIDAFQDCCNQLIDALPIEGIAAANRMLTISMNVYEKYPLVFIPDFLEDFVGGLYAKKIAKKYRLSDFNDLQKLCYALKIPTSRKRGASETVRDDNMKISAIRSQYDLFLSQISMFRAPLLRLINCGILRAMIAHVILENDFVLGSEIKDKVLNMEVEFRRDLEHLANPEKRKSFESYMEEDLDSKIREAVADLYKKSYIVSMDGNVSLPAKYSDVGGSMRSLISASPKGISYSSLRTKIIKEFPMFGEVTDRKRFDRILDGMESRGEVVVKRAFWLYRPYSDQVFTPENYQRIMEDIRRQVVSQGRTKFFGRAITPDEFIEELVGLEAGDFGDSDDQVTRIAGLILTHSAMLQSPREHVEGFDFMVDLAGYSFRPEQERLMRDLDFKVTSSTFHCKVMINEALTTKTVDALRREVPDGEQGVIFTCMPIPRSVIEQTKSDPTIQIVDEDGIRTWCGITPVIPCRLNSVARVMYGDGAGSIVLVQALSYESGLATARVIRGGEETTFPIRCLREIDLGAGGDDLHAASEAYCNFLAVVSDLSPDAFDDGMAMPKASVFNTRRDLAEHVHKMQHAEGKMYPSGIEARIMNMAGGPLSRYAEIDDALVAISPSGDPGSSIQCTCSYFVNQEYYFALCKHIVALLDQVTREKIAFSGDPVGAAGVFVPQLRRFHERSARKTADAIYHFLDEGSRDTFKRYLRAVKSLRDPPQ